jgi:hypothetical protein
MSEHKNTPSKNSPSETHPSQKKRAKKRVAKKPTSAAILNHMKNMTNPAPLGNQYAKGHGRPSLCKPEYGDAMIRYFEEEIEKCLKVGVDAQENDKVIALGFVTFKKFAKSIGVYAATLKDWANAVNEDGTPKHKEFSHAYKTCKDMQEDLLIQGGLLGVYKSGFATLAAMNIMGWKTQAETSNEHQHSMANVKELCHNAMQTNERGSENMMNKMHEERKDF